MYYYRENTDDTFLNSREPFEGELPPLPEYGWLRQVKP
jgi:hypothetical protein